MYHRESLIREILINGEFKLIVSLSRIIEQSPTSASPDLLPAGIGVACISRTAGDEARADGGLDHGVGVAGEEEGDTITGVPAYEVGEVPVRVSFEVVAERVGDLPFFDLAPGADVKALVQLLG